ncbi:unnamed protein product, partial [Didymodactylos carnosus]
FSHSVSFITQAKESNSSYPMLVRLAIADELHNNGRIEFLKRHNWFNVAIIHQDSIAHALTMAELSKRLNSSNITVIIMQSVSMSNLTDGLRTLQAKKARVIFASFDAEYKATFFCQIYRTIDKLLRNRYVWILTGEDQYWWNKFTLKESNISCTRDQILQTANGHFIIDSVHETLENSTTTIANIVCIIDPETQYHRLLFE